MRTFLSFLALATIVGTSTAQLEQNKWRVWDQTTEYTSRGSINANVGWVSQSFRPAELAGVTELSYIQYVMQDQDQATVEPWDLQWTQLSGAGVPDYATAASVMTIAPNLALPKGVGIGAWFVTHNMNANAAASFKIPKQATGTNEAAHMTWYLKSSPPPNWATDGLGVHMSQSAAGLPSNLAGKLCVYSAAASRNFHREIPRTEKINNQITQPDTKLAWASTPGTPAQPPLPRDRAWRLDVGTPTAVLSVASDNKVYNTTVATGTCPNPNQGYAGLFPDFNDEVTNTPKRYDDPHFILNGGNSKGGAIGILLMSTALGSTPLSIQGFSGQLYLDLTDPLLLLTVGTLAFPLNGSGAAAFTLPFGAGGPSNKLRPLVASFINWHFQVAIVTTTGNHFSSLATMTPTLTNKGAYMQGTTVKGTALKLTGASVKNVLNLRNDGNATITVHERNGSNTFRSHVVPEGSSVRIRRFPAAVEIHIESNKTTKSTVTWVWEA